MIAEHPSKVIGTGEEQCIVEMHIVSKPRLENSAGSIFLSISRSGSIAIVHRGELNDGETLLEIVRVSGVVINSVEDYANKMIQLQSSNRLGLLLMSSAHMTAQIAGSIREGLQQKPRTIHTLHRMAPVRLGGSGLLAGLVEIEGCLLHHPVAVSGDRAADDVASGKLSPALRVIHSDAAAGTHEDVQDIPLLRSMDGPLRRSAGATDSIGYGATDSIGYGAAGPSAAVSPHVYLPRIATDGVRRVGTTITVTSSAAPPKALAPPPSSKLTAADQLQAALGTVPSSLLNHVPDMLTICLLDGRVLFQVQNMQKKLSRKCPSLGPCLPWTMPWTMLFISL